jgi:GT2 family glycosyltransferase
VNASTEAPVLAAVINWNGWRDTVICLRSMFALVGPPVNVVVCDNASTDGSFAHLLEWLCGEAGGRMESRALVGELAQLVIVRGSFGAAVKGVYLLALPENHGYAGGANRCISWGRAALGARDFWVLNNDIKVHPDALAALVSVTTSMPGIGLCGSVLMDWDDPQRVQAIGGNYCRWIASGSHFTQLPSGAAGAGKDFLPLDYPVGASLFITHSYLEAVGLMDETYFLYYEEIDWAQRGRSHGFTPGVALRSLVQHREGASTGSHGGVRKKSLLSERYGVVNRLRVTRKFWPSCLPLVWMSLWLVLLDRVAHAEWRRARLVLKLMFTPRLWLGEPIT